MTDDNGYNASATNQERIENRNARRSGENAGGAKIPVQDTSRLGRFRDNLAHRLCTAALAFATPWYRAMIGGAIIYGLEASAKNSLAQEVTGP